MTTKNKVFGTDGIRCKANEFPMTAEVALAVGRAVAYVAKSGPHKHKIVIGKDTRVSGYIFENAVVSGICSMGVDALLVGVIPTAGVAYLTKDLRADAGIMITASHNSYEDNGFKIFGRDGFKLSDEQEQDLEYFILGFRKFEGKDPVDEKVGKAYRIEDARGRYIAHVKSVFPDELDLCGVKIGLDAANGAAYKIAPKIFEELGAEIRVLRGAEPNGTNINDCCGALHTKHFSDDIKIDGCDIGISLDGDADRLVLVDETGMVVNGDALLAIAAEDLIKTEGPQAIVATVMSNSALDEFVAGLGGSVVRADVGDRYVIDEMRRGGHRFGGENSGHIIYAKHGTTGDGLVAALKVLAIMRKTGKKLSELSGLLKLYPQAIRNIDVKEKVEIKGLPELQDAIDEAYSQLNGTGRVLVRYSGTENKLRIMVECKVEEIAVAAANKIEETARKVLGVV